MLSGGNRMLCKIIPLLFCTLVLSCSLASLAAPVTHPNLFLNRAEIEQVKANIAKYPWAAAALETTKERALGKDPDDPFGGMTVLYQAHYFAFTGDKSFADMARGRLLGMAQSGIPQYETLDI